jgi:hypothetical protein
MLEGAKSMGAGAATILIMQEGRPVSYHGQTIATKNLTELLSRSERKVVRWACILIPEVLVRLQLATRPLVIEYLGASVFSLDG